MTADVYTTVPFKDEFSTRKSNVRLEKLFITLLLFIGICGFAVVTLEANTPSADFSSLQAPVDTEQATFKGLVRH